MGFDETEILLGEEVLPTIDEVKDFGTDAVGVTSGRDVDSKGATVDAGQP